MRIIRFGVAACLLFWFTGSLLPCMAVHAFNNAIAIVFGSQAKAETAGGHKSGRGQAQAGFVLGIVAVVGSIINMIVTAAIIAS